VWRRCYAERDKAVELLGNIEPLAKVGLGGIVFVEIKI
jgi:hypothetical protein